MPEFFTLLKPAFSFIGSVFGFISKRYAQPKIECNIVKVYRNRILVDVPDQPGLIFHEAVYHYEIRLTNQSEHHAYHPRIVECNVPIYQEYLDYHVPVFEHNEKTCIIYIKDTNVEPKWQTPIGDSMPPIKELKIQYTNSKGRKFYTIFRPDLDIEEQNELGRM